MRNILFVCSANKDRSKTAEDFFSEKFQKIDFASAGTNTKTCHQKGTQPLTKELLDWAELVIAMEEKHRTLIKTSYRSKSNSYIKVLAIPDRYKYYQKELIELLIRKAEPHIIENL